MEWAKEVIEGMQATQSMISPEEATDFEQRIMLALKTSAETLYKGQLEPNFLILNNKFDELSEKIKRDVKNMTDEYQAQKN